MGIATRLTLARLHLCPEMQAMANLAILERPTSNQMTDMLRTLLLTDSRVRVDL